MNPTRRLSLKFWVIASVVWVVFYLAVSCMNG